MTLPSLNKILLVLCLTVGTSYATEQSNTAPPPPEASTTVVQSIPTDKILVTFNQLPPEGAYQVIGPISVYKRWFGGTGAAMTLLGEKARSLGANAVVETRVWLAPAFPAQVAPHGSGIAVRIDDPVLLHALADEASSWE